MHPLLPNTSIMGSVKRGAILIAAASILFTSTACSGSGAGKDGDAHSGHHHSGSGSGKSSHAPNSNGKTTRAPNGDLQERTASASILPAFLNGKDKRLAQVYSLAGQNHELLNAMPCYCGCADSAGHMSNKQCFIKQVHADGSVIWDDHGTRCHICLEIAVKAVQLKQQGLSLTDIRDSIDQQYKHGYPKPTPTPRPAS